MANPTITPVSWAEQATLSPAQRDCVTAVVLKILDRKCKMPAGQQEAMLAIYEMLGDPPCGLFEKAVHDCIAEALQQPFLPTPAAEQLHQFRLQAEEKIPKPIMKAFKRKLREELFDQLPVTR